MSEDPIQPELQKVEDELRGLRPAPLRESFRERMLTTRSTWKQRVGLWLTAAAVLLCAATLLWMAMRPTPSPGRIAAPQSEGTDPVHEMPPTWLAYTRAASSPEELDRLLTVHEGQLLPTVRSLEIEIHM